MASPNTMQQPVTVEYDRGKKRVQKTFDNPYAAKRFYVQKNIAGKVPRVLGGKHNLPAGNRSTAERTGRPVAAGSKSKQSDTQQDATTQDNATQEGQRHYSMEGLVPSSKIKQFKFLVESTINVRVRVLIDEKYGYTSFELLDPDMVLTGKRHKQAVLLLRAIEFGLATKPAIRKADKFAMNGDDEE